MCMSINMIFYRMMWIIIYRFKDFIIFFLLNIICNDVLWIYDVSNMICVGWFLLKVLEIIFVIFNSWCIKIILVDECLVMRCFVNEYLYLVDK